MNSIYLKTTIASIVILLLSACATVPESIQYTGGSNLTVQAVQQNSVGNKGQTVRWGGIITQVINNEKDTWVELLALDLRDSGRPISNRENNQGRFIAKIGEFLDPAVYQVGHSFTVVGNLADKLDGTIGKFKYSFPVVDVKGHYLWPRNIYRHVPYIMPGYWYYGAHPMWNFGYSYYGFGVRRHFGYYPYFPLYGHLQQRVAPITIQRPRMSYTINDRLWEHRVNELAVHRRVLAQSARPTLPNFARQTNGSATSTRIAKPRAKQITSGRSASVKIPRKPRKANKANR